MWHNVLSNRGGGWGDSIHGVPHPALSMFDYSSTFATGGTLSAKQPDLCDTNRMVLRHPACVLSVGLLVVGLQSVEARAWPRFVVGRSSFNGVGEATAERGARLFRPRATALRLGERGQTCLAPSSGRTGPWGLGAVSAMARVKRI